eukprot:TRINITY_DN1589_c0_g3_i1.p1 TRINITY_DN1589_c0_g3~~TRINITY_DN1589_c0_g3_i1.p1  ORF type:complete len:139 (-),score=39.78 TRINITY_DN1589_c0_g3_i1:31-399(-)
MCIRDRYQRRVHGRAELEPPPVIQPTAHSVAIVQRQRKAQAVLTKFGANRSQKEYKPPRLRSSVSIEPKSRTKMRRQMSTFEVREAPESPAPDNFESLLAPPSMREIVNRAVQILLAGDLKN